MKAKGFICAHCGKMIHHGGKWWSPQPGLFLGRAYHKACLKEKLARRENVRKGKK